MSDDPNRCRFCSQWNPPMGGLALRRCRFCNNSFDAAEDATAIASGPARMSRQSVPIAPVIRPARPSGAYGSARAGGGGGASSRRGIGGGVSISLPIKPLAFILGVLLALALVARMMGWY